MNLIFKTTNECCRAYNRSTKGYEFICVTDSVEDFFNKIVCRENEDMFPTSDQFSANETILDASGNEVYDPNYPETFDFTDYQYHIESTDNMDSYNDAHKIRAIKAANSNDMDDILKLIAD